MASIFVIKITVVQFPLMMTVDKKSKILETSVVLEHSTPLRIISFLYDEDGI